MRAALLIITSLLTVAELSAQQDSVYIFSYFKDNGQDGLHLAYSTNGPYHMKSSICSPNDTGISHEFVFASGRRKERTVVL